MQLKTWAWKPSFGLHENRCVGVGELAGEVAVEPGVGDADEFAVGDEEGDHQFVLGVGGAHVRDGVAD